jgi:putative nucleotidyltransferase with HDIG domain
LTHNGAPTREPSAAAGGRHTRPIRRLKLRHVLFLTLLLSGIVPLAISSAVLIWQNRTLLVNQEREHLVRSAEVLSQQADDLLAGLRRELSQRGDGLLAFIGSRDLEAELREPWVEDYLRSFQTANPQVEALRVLDLDGVGPRMAPKDLNPAAAQALDSAFEQARSHSEAVYRLVDLPGAEEPRAVVAVPVPSGGEPRLILESLNRIELLEAVFASGQTPEVGVLLADGEGRILWANPRAAPLAAAVAASGLLHDLSTSAVHFTRPFVTDVDGEQRVVEATGSRVEETGWRVVVLKPTVAQVAVHRMIVNTVLSSLLLVLLALFLAAGVARWVGRPTQRLADTTDEIAAGNFGHRVELGGLSFEMADLAENFNRMSGYVESYVEQLRRAASANRELFIGSIRAFAAAIDAKDPYTRGHSERVATVSRTLARHLAFDEEFQQRVWLGALLHDVGKIGVDDRVLKKGGLLTPDEFDQMKQHTVIGAEIMGRIDQLKEIIPAIRWHHENWNGRGYPDGLKGEQIPLIARIVAVADTFDAVTTTRPYQQAYTLEFAVETVTRLAGTRFDAKVVTAFLSAFNSGQVEGAMGRMLAPTAELAVGVAMGR